MTAVIRERRPADLPTLVEVLGAQQATSHYPVRWPLPFPTEDFIVRPNELASWVAEVDGRVVGHVAVMRAEGELGDRFVELLGTDRLAEVAVLFVALETLGTGVGGRLLDTAVAWIRGSGRRPVLDVVPAHDRALAVYVHRGWRVIGEARPAFLGPTHPPMVLMILD